MDVNKTLDEMQTMAKLKLPSEVSIRLLPGADYCIIHTVPKRVRQVLNNYLSNALKHTEEGFIDIGYHLPQEDRIRFFVRDTGCGIPPEKQKDVFERFVKLNSFKQGTVHGDLRSSAHDCRENERKSGRQLYSGERFRILVRNTLSTYRKPTCIKKPATDMNSVNDGQPKPSPMLS